MGFGASERVGLEDSGLGHEGLGAGLEGRVLLLSVCSGVGLVVDSTAALVLLVGAQNRFLKIEKKVE